MSVIVKGMEMPKSCQECGLYIEGACYAKGYRDYRSIMDTAKPDDCPLVDIPTPHGRLGDLDALYAEISNGNKAYNGIEGYDGKYPNIANVDDCLDAIKYAETVIEAEGREE